MKVRLTKERDVENYGVPYVIAEIGANHNGDMDLARELIDSAAKAGADCVKFQAWSKSSLFTREFYERNKFPAGARSGLTLEQQVEKYSLSEKQFTELCKYSRRKGVEFTASAFSMREAEFLANKLKVPFIKIASMDVNNYQFLFNVGKLGRPVVLSTGLSTLAEIDRAVMALEGSGNRDIVLMHCVAAYPADDADVNLNNITTLQRIYAYPIGFSDHTIGVSIPVASVALGACVIEKHFTVDKALKGWDHGISADPAELQAICRESKRVAKAMGTFRIVAPEPDSNKQVFKRSIVSARAIKKGELIREADIDYKRPGTGLPPELRDFVVGKKARRDIAADTIITGEDI